MSWKICSRPNGLVGFWADRRKSHRTLSQWKAVREKNTVSPGKLSPNAKRKILRAIKWLSAAAQTKKVYEKKFGRVVDWKINMITFTFHENLQDDKKARMILSKWIDMAKHRFNLNSYIWKAEPQERGAIHFHMCTDVYIPYAELRYTWNRLLRKHKLNNIEDNSTDIHAVIHVKNLQAYLSEYLTKDDKHKGRRKIKGKLWGCSHGLSQAGKEYLLLDNDELSALHDGLKEYHLSTINERAGRWHPEILKFVDIWCFPNDYYESMPDCELRKLYYSEIEKLKPKLKQQVLPLLV